MRDERGSSDDQAVAALIARMVRVSNGEDGDLCTLFRAIEALEPGAINRIRVALAQGSLVRNRFPIH